MTRQIGCPTLRPCHRSAKSEIYGFSVPTTSCAAMPEIPQPSPLDGMAGAEQAMHEHGHQLREVKLVSEKKAIARWKAGELGWRRVA